MSDTARWVALVAGVGLILAGLVPIVRDLARMRAPLARGATRATELVWAALPVAFLGVLIVVAANAV